MPVLFVSKKHLQFAKEHCKLFNSAEITLEEVIAVIAEHKDCQDEKIIIGTLKDITEKVKKENIKNQAQILLGEFIDSEHCRIKYSKSKLYDSDFSHRFRKSARFNCEKYLFHK